jgi:hypothetical protein
MEEFEQELRQALKPQSAPPGLKGKIMARRRLEQRSHAVLWQRLAASLAFAAVLSGAVKWDLHLREERRGEAARQQVMTALRITSHALNHMNQQLAAHNRAHRD